MHSNEMTASISDENAATWDKQDRMWMLTLYGTAVGAGTLFLPINAGVQGIWPLIMMIILAFPLTFFSHRALCRFVLSGHSNGDITQVVQEHFGQKKGQLVTCLYFLAIFPILLMYSVAITNTTESFIVHQLGFVAPPRALLSFILIALLMGVIQFGESLVVKSVSLLVYPFVVILMLLSIYLIPHWNGAIFKFQGVQAGQHGLLKALWLMLPVMVFSFNHAPIISSFAVAQKKRVGRRVDEKCTSILKYSHLMMVITVMFFVVSCVLSLSPQDLLIAKQENISILSYLANHFNNPLIAYIAPIIAFIAISKSFFGHYLGAREGISSLFNASTGCQLSHAWIKAVIMMSCWLVATLNISILGMIEVVGGPAIALLLFLMPMYAMQTVPALKHYARLKSNVFVILIGLCAMSAILYGLF